MRLSVPDATLPGVLYGSDNDFNVMKHTIKISQKDVMRELRIRGASFENTVYNLTVKKELDEMNEDNTPKTEVVVQYLVTPRQTHFSPGTYTRCVNVSLVCLLSTIPDVGGSNYHGNIHGCCLHIFN